MSTLECGNCHWSVTAHNTEQGDEAVFRATEYHVCPVIHTKDL